MTSTPVQGLSALFAQPEGKAVDWAEYNKRWDGIWSDGLQPGQRFDAGKCAPVLLDVLASGLVNVRDRAVLVPGCGRGYDVLAVAQAGAREALGLEISQTAVLEASKHRDQTLAASLAPRAVFAEADFFTYSGSFDVGYDYTFLCALHPDMRTDWAASWARVLRPGGELLTLVFPVDPTLDPGQGPPWPVTPNLYRHLLVDSGLFECVSLEPVDSQLSHPGRAGREWLGRWARTTADGPAQAASAAAAKI